MRVPSHRYRDPLDRIWLTTAARIGLHVERTPDAYASTPGNGALLLATAEHLDQDDCIAQLVFHELCHSLVQGEASFRERDWGLDNESDRDVIREEACLRAQAVLSGRHGLRRILAPTTDFRAFYDALPEDPLMPRWVPSVSLAVTAVRRAEQPPWAPHLLTALAATRAVAESTSGFAREAEVELWSLVDRVPAAHPSGLPAAAAAEPGRTCGSCAWRSRQGRCRQSRARVTAETHGCERWEPLLDCRECGACCRAAYDLVQVSPRDPVRKKHPSLVVVKGPFLEMQRQGDRCAALSGGSLDPGAQGATPVPYSCTIYGDRPKSCREFERGGEHCLTARRRVGLSL